MALVAIADERVPMPRHDPFAQPVLKKLRLKKTHSENTLPESEKPWLPVLTSTLRAGSNSIAIVGGRVIKIGQQVEGYRLLEVGEQDALFEKDGNKIRLRLDD